MKKENLKQNIKVVIIVSALTLSYSSICHASGLSKLDSAGFKILDIVRKVGYWIIVVQATKEIIKSAMSGATKDIGGIVLKYVLMYGALFAIPWALKLVEGVF